MEENGAVYPDYWSGDVWLKEITTARVFPPLIRVRDPNMLVLMLVIEFNKFLSFGTKLEDTFSKLLDINDVLIVKPIRGGTYSTKLALRLS